MPNAATPTVARYHRHRAIDQPEYPTVPLRGFVLSTLSVTAAVLVWRRTRGDRMLTAVTAPAVFGALSCVIR
jgi:hypothetical protein